MIQLQDVPTGFWSASVLPYDPHLNVILPIAEIVHARNGYSVTVDPWAVIPAAGVLVS